MTLTLSPPVRYAALLGLLAAALLGAGMMLMGQSGSSTTAAPHVIKHHPFGPGVKKVSSPAPRKVSATPATKQKPAAATNLVAPAPAAKAAEKPSATVTALALGLPGPIASALGKHAIVVVSLYNPYSEVDGIAFAEARAGAQMSGAGFVPLSVLSQAQVGKLTDALGLLPDPGLLVYTRPGTLVARISGFADKETVAQAAQNAANAGS